MFKKLFTSVLVCCLLCSTVSIPFVSADSFTELYKFDFESDPNGENFLVSTNDGAAGAVRGYDSMGIGGRASNDTSFMFDSRGYSQTVGSKSPYFRIENNGWAGDDASKQIAVSSPVIIETGMYFHDLTATRVIEFTARLDGTDSFGRDLAIIENGVIKAAVGGGYEEVFRVKAGSWYHFAFVIESDGSFDMYVNHNKIEKNTYFNFNSKPMTHYVRTKVYPRFNIETTGQIMDTMTAFDDINIYCGAQPLYANESVGIESKDEALFTVDQATSIIGFSAIGTMTASEFKGRDAIEVIGERGTVELFNADGSLLGDDDVIQEGQILRLTYDSANGYIIINYEIADAGTQKILEADGSEQPALYRTRDIATISVRTGVAGRDTSDKSIVIHTDKHERTSSNNNVDPSFRYEPKIAVTKFPIVMETSIYFDDLNTEIKVEFGYCVDGGDPATESNISTKNILVFKGGNVNVLVSGNAQSVARIQEKNWYHFAVVMQASGQYEVFMNYKQIEVSGTPSMTDSALNITNFARYNFIQNFYEKEVGDLLDSYTAFDDIKIYGGIDPPFEGTVLDMSAVDGSESVLRLDNENKKIVFENREDLTVSELISDFSAVGGLAEFSIIDSIGLNAKVLKGTDLIPDEGVYYLRYLYDSGDHGVIIMNYELISGLNDSYEFTFDTTGSNVAKATVKITNITGENISGRLIICSYTEEGRLIGTYIDQSPITVDEEGETVSKTTEQGVSTVGADYVKAFFWLGEVGALNGISSERHEL